MKDITLPFVIPRRGSDAEGSAPGSGSGKEALRFEHEGPYTIGAEMRMWSLNETGIDRRISPIKSSGL